MFTAAQILVAGIGNIFLGDDAFGVEVVSELCRPRFPGSVSVRDFGIRSYDLAYALLDGYDVDNPGGRVIARRSARDTCT